MFKVQLLLGTVSKSLKRGVNIKKEAGGGKHFSSLASLQFPDCFSLVIRTIHLGGTTQLLLNLNLEKLKAVQPDLNRNVVTKRKESQ